MSTTTPSPARIRSARRAFLIVGLVAPVVIAAAALVLILIWLPELPDRVVTHWGPSGPDGFGSPAAYVWMQLLVGLGIPLLLTLPVLGMMRDAWGPTCRLLGAMSLGIAVLIAAASAGSVAIQRGSGDVDAIGVVVALGVSGMLVFGAVGWFAQPNVVTPPAPGRTARLQLAPGERAAWFGTASMGRAGVIGLGVAVLILAVTTVWVLLLEPGVGWILAGLTVLLVVLIATTLVFRVRAGAEGLNVRSVAGWPRWSIPASDIADVQVVTVNPMGDFGGWGLRLSVDGRVGVVLRTGEALQITRRKGRPFVVTVDDAETAAAVLSAQV